MDVSKISAGKDVPNDVNVVIEIPQGSSVKYEVDKESGAIFVDRFLFTPMAYPTAYGFIPNTLAADGDPVDALVLTPAAVVPGSVIRARPIGVLHMEDESGRDEKLICVPHDKIHPQFHDITSVNQLPEITLKSIAHFFERYKDLEPNKWVKVSGWADKDAACKVIEESIAAAKK
ncbi:MULTISPECIES: inorganic diphosphatase [unclassified Saccharibacter]|uniref:inorganic diphosphatase n=1 Tax=unclassified Saccharibacter TaxID=2648722 RepID=UPI00132A132D|nr:MULTISPECIES: inorganic diphosphatase [unclassified Saccharibacter]MXV36575.1 inorganic diphosphatase [Saccharibacter sp. EH611]MXV57737.1 inorganic diphosphatase [Saccharibacter sp. EH70]MXV64956.1 inorganic diphosphatase [Saccharibacter sp. EH60]